MTLRPHSKETRKTDPTHFFPSASISHHLRLSRFVPTQLIQNSQKGGIQFSPQKKFFKEFAYGLYIILWMKMTTGSPLRKQGTWEQETANGSPGGQGSVSQQFQASKPADQQGRFCGRGLGPRGHGFLFGPFLLEWNGGAAMEI